jgi:hypothetical protein
MRAIHNLRPQQSVEALRVETEMAIEMLIDLLDLIDGDENLEPYLTGYSDGMEDREGDPADAREEDPAESGIADFDGYMEQLPHLFQHCDVRVEA